jgi:hypothetical protein
MGKTFELNCSKVRAVMPLIASEAERICRGFVEVYNSDVRGGLRGEGRGSVDVSEETILGLKFTALIPIGNALAIIHKDRLEEVVGLMWEMIRAFEAQHDSAHRAYSDVASDPPQKRVILYTLMATGDSLTEKSQESLQKRLGEMPEGIIESYRFSFGKLRGKPEDIADLIARYDAAGTFAANAVSARKLAQDLFLT